MTRENYVRYSFYDATGCQYIEVTKMENAKGENSIKHLSLYKYGYLKVMIEDTLQVLSYLVFYRCKEGRT